MDISGLPGTSVAIEGPVPHRNKGPKSFTGWLQTRTVRAEPCELRNVRHEKQPPKFWLKTQLRVTVLTTTLFRNKRWVNVSVEPKMLVISVGEVPGDEGVEGCRLNSSFSAST